MFQACTDYQQRQYDKLKSKCSTLSHEERLSLAKRTNAAAMGMIVAGTGCFIGLTAGLWNSIGSGAIGAGFGGACGLWFGSCGVFEEAKLILKFDEELTAAAAAETKESNENSENVWR